MPSLDRHPDDALLDTIRDLKRQLDEVRTLRSRPSPGAAVSTLLSGQVIPALTYTTLDWQSTFYSSAGMADLAANTITIPSSGVYLVVISAGTISGAAQNAILQVLAPVSQPALYSFLANATWGEQVGTFTRPYLAGEELRLQLHLSTAAATITGAFTWTVERLHDTPDQS